CTRCARARVVILTIGSFDLCSLTIGNFHYREMMLVRDYTKLSEDGAMSPAFDSVFSLEPKHTEDEPPAPLPLAEQFPVIPCDAAQAAAVARSRDGRSFLIQGPPGTWKIPDDHQPDRRLRRPGKTRPVRL
ncbi:MAG: hypothetical protein QM760_09470, partial [Nibricoccus sp.]